MLTCNSSWSIVFEVLNDESTWNREHANLESLLSEEEALQLLSKPYNPFSFSASDTKSAFETKTAAINVTPSSKSHYNINEIKEDAVWLSKEAEIDEVSALRIVVLEYQTRSAAQLQATFLEEEVASLREAAGDLNTESSSVLSRTILSKPTSSAATSDASKIQGDRRLRALRIYLSERLHLLKCTELLLHIHFRHNATRAEGKAEKGKGNKTSSLWTKRVGQRLTDSVEQSGQGYAGFLIYCIRGLKANLEALSNDRSWLKSAISKDNLELEWASDQLTEAVHAMEIIFLLLDYRTTSRSAPIVLEWFRFMSIYGFFDRFEAVSYGAVVPFIENVLTMVDSPMKHYSLLCRL